LLKAKSKSEVLSGLQERSASASHEERTRLFRQISIWLERKRCVKKVALDDPAAKFMAEVLAKRMHSLPWESEIEHFKEALREYGRMGVRALEAGIWAEDEQAKKTGRVQSQRQVFVMAEEALPEVRE
jgi:hypothetical protein